MFLKALNVSEKALHVFAKAFRVFQILNAINVFAFLKTLIVFEERLIFLVAEPRVSDTKFSHAIIF